MRFGSVLRWFAVICALGVLAGVLWNVLAPHVAGTSTSSGVVFATPDAPSATITAWYLGITGIAGLLTGVPMVALADQYTVKRAASIIVAGLCAGCLAYAVGFLLGPDPIADQVRGSATPVRVEQPLVLPSALLVLFWPAASALLGVVGLLLSVMLVGPPRTAASPHRGQHETADGPHTGRDG